MRRIRNMKRQREDDPAEERERRRELLEKLRDLTDTKRQQAERRRRRGKRKVKCWWDYENARLPRDFDVSRIRPTMEAILSREGYRGGELWMKMVVSDSTDSEKIGWRTYRKLYNEPDIHVHDCEIPNTQQISDDRIKREIREWIAETEEDELLVLIAGDQGYLEILEEVRASEKNIHIFLIYPKNVTNVVIQDFEAEGRETWENFLAEAQRTSGRRGRGGGGDDEDGSGGGGGGGDGRRGGGGSGSKKGGGGGKGGSNPKPSTIFPLGFCNKTLTDTLGPFKKPRQSSGYSGPITITGELSKDSDSGTLEETAYVGLRGAKCLR